MKDLLFLSQRIPYPPDKGDKIRSYHILRHLGERYRIHLGCFVDDPDDLEHLPALQALCADSHIAVLDPRWAKIRCTRGFLTGQALNLPYYRDAGLAAWVARVLARVVPDVVFVYSSAVAQYVLAPAPRPRRLIMDFIDVDSDKWRQYADTQKWPLSWVYRRESRTLLDFDRRVAQAADASIFVSGAETDLFQRLAPESAEKVHAIGNGIDSAYFSPERDYERPFDAPGPVFVFTGAMDYWPNVDAVTWFAKEIFPRIRDRFDGAAFFIVGGRPTAEVIQLGDLAGVHVTGRVADVRPYLAHAGAAVVPMRIARGIQNKVIEGMSMARPVIATPQAFEGIEATAGDELFVADGAEAFFQATVRAIENPAAAAAVGAAARRRIVQDFTWPARMAQLDRLLVP